MSRRQGIGKALRLIDYRAPFLEQSRWSKQTVNYSGFAPQEGHLGLCERLKEPRTTHSMADTFSAFK